MKKLLILFFVIGVSLAGCAQQTVHYEAFGGIITNPERGFYAHHQSTNAATLLNKETLIRHREEEGISLILMLYYLPDFMEGPISEEALSNMETNFNTMREAGVKCVLRFAYRWSQNTHPYDPEVAIVEEHIRNITPVIRSGSDVIAVVQTGFVGVWGEWYYTDNFGFPTPDFDKRNKVVDGLLNALPDRRMIQLRTPKLKYGICDITYTDPLSPELAFSGEKIARIGHHNDCFLASSTDYGTYGNIANDKAFLAEETRYLPMGGETCNPSSYSECSNALEEMERFHWSYLNSGYHQTVLNDWRVNGCMDEVKKRLGYRFVLKTGVFTERVAPGHCFSIQLDIENEGFAAPFNPRDVEIILRKTDWSADYWVRLPDNPQFWLPGETQSIAHEIHLPADLPEGEYKVYLNLPDPEPDLFDRPEYAIRTANNGTWNSEMGYNYLQHVLTVDAQADSESCSADLSFIPFPRVPHLDKITAVNTWNISKFSKLYPNPVGTGQHVQLEFSADFRDEALLRITSITGQTIREENIVVEAGNNLIHLADSRNLNNGLYTITIQGSKSHLVKKLAVQK